MQIGFIGSGPVARQLGAAFSRAGHTVRLGQREGRPSFADAIAGADLVVVAIPYRVCADVLPALAASLRGRIVIDATNPLTEDYAPMTIDGGRSAAEAIAALLPGARVVKAFNTVFADAMLSASDEVPALAAFVAGDDAAALETVSGLAAQAGYAPFAVPQLAAARYLEALAHLNIALAFGGLGTRGGFVYRQVSSPTSTGA